MLDNKKQILLSFVDFGFHLVPVGHPHSDMNMMEWRISFSIAERTLLWSFTHIQKQCYAVIRLILKEFINPHCRPTGRILCSYFIKTFLFWEYEETDPSYWCKENFRECVMSLFAKFCECARVRSLRHYFILSFNLMSVKMTDEAQMELLRIFDIILQSDIAILKECKTMNKVWIECFHHDADTIDVIQTVKRNVLRNDVCMMYVIEDLQHVVLNLPNQNYVIFFEMISKFIDHFHLHHTVYKTNLALFATKMIFHHPSISLAYIPLRSIGNKQKRSTEGCSKFKSPETRQVQERLVSTSEHMQVPKWDRTRCPEE